MGLRAGGPHLVSGCCKRDCALTAASPALTHSITMLATGSREESVDAAAEVDTLGLLEEPDDEEFSGPRTWGDWFLALHPMARWFVVTKALVYAPQARARVSEPLQGASLGAGAPLGNHQTLPPPPPPACFFLSPGSSYLWASVDLLARWWACCSVLAAARTSRLPSRSPW